MVRFKVQVVHRGGRICTCRYLVSHREKDEGDSEIENVFFLMKEPSLGKKPDQGCGKPGPRKSSIVGVGIVKKS